MTATATWAATALGASAAMMLLVLAVRAPVRRWIGPQLAYVLWILPVLRLALPGLPVDARDRLPLLGQATTGVSVLFVGPRAGPGLADALQALSADNVLFVTWLIGFAGLLTVYAVRHAAFCKGLRATATDLGHIGTIRIIAADIEGPLAFGVFRRFIAVPRAFALSYSRAEREFALAHERAHHARGDLIANWVSLLALAAHWWNPIAWVAIRAFRDDQELAADAHVLAGREPAATAVYAQVIAKAAGIGALPACNLHARINLKGRLMMLAQKPRSNTRRMFGASAMAVLGSAALAATAATHGTSGPVGKQVVTIGVKPDGSGGYALIVGSAAIAPPAPGTPLPDGRSLPADLSAAGGCDLKPTAKPVAMVIKGFGGTQTYTVMCASAAPAPTRTTVAEGLASLKTMRASVAAQPASASFPEAERTHALGAIDRSIHEVEVTLAAMG